MQAWREMAVFPVIEAKRPEIRPMSLSHHSSTTIDSSGIATQSSSSPEAPRLVARAWGIVSAPKAEWLLIATESTTSLRIFGRYVAPLACMAAIVPILRMPANTRAPLAGTLGMAALTFGLDLLRTWLLAEVVNALAPFFGGARDRRAAVKLVAYSLTPLWLAELLLPSRLLMPLLLFGAFYGTYLLYRGVGVVMKSPPQQAFGYAATTLLCALALGIVFVQIAARAGTPWLGHGFAE